ncbi:membrane-spanning 4-domains subfamily A member 3 isoform X1 [Perognathus longimembris pacificus]|uniref:membrane-spanning 4-domains subfamily A member 3 isoform X1 n=1 Tax=Perognathus longimembris pacificus TaxID=214514 RepID=UPI0020198AAC|nr:membrane-spanning 4-domains subfamily A member 3 isoform X1 [Perognathus longimembris pacificus]
MASQEVATDGLETEGAGTPGSQVESDGVNISIYRPLNESHYQEGTLQALGAVQILNGAMVLALGIWLASLLYLSHLFRHFFFFTFYTGYPLWGPVFFISSGSLSVAAGRNPTRMLMQNSFGMNIASATIALVGTAFLSVHLALNSQSFKGCQSSQSPDLCIYMGSSSNGLVSLMLILTLLELAITITMSVMWCQGNFCDSREEVYPPSNPGGSEIPADESNAASINIRPPVSSEAALPPSAQEDGS